MEQIKFSSVDGTLVFYYPWEWMENKNFKPKTNDLESVAKRGKLNGKLYRKRQAQIPDYVIPINCCVLRRDIKILLSIIKQEKYYVTYFDHWAGRVVTTEFYSPKPELPVKKIPYDDNYDNILYAPFEFEIIGYGDVS